MKFNLSYISEKDIDLLIIEELSINETFSNLFFNSIGMGEYRILEVSHSVTHSKYGESDIQVLYETNGLKCALLIEDKINAIAMSEQAARYIKRGNEGVKKGLYSNYYVFICAPSTYLSSNEEARKYPYRISYEQLLDTLEQSNINECKRFKIALLRFALSKKNLTYNPIIHNDVTVFWEQLYKYIDENYSHFKIKKIKRGRGENAVWPIFTTDQLGIRVYLKSDLGVCDLSISCISKDMVDLKENLINLVEPDMKLVKTSKSISIRIYTQKLDFKKSFYEQLNFVDMNLFAINRLLEFTYRHEKLLGKFVL